MLEIKPTIKITNTTDADIESGLCYVVSTTDSDIMPEIIRPGETLEITTAGKLDIAAAYLPEKMS